MSQSSCRLCHSPNASTQTCPLNPVSQYSDLTIHNQIKQMNLIEIAAIIRQQLTKGEQKQYYRIMTNLNYQLSLNKTQSYQKQSTSPFSTNPDNISKKQNDLSTVASNNQSPDLSAISSDQTEITPDIPDISEDKPDISEDQPDISDYQPDISDEQTNMSEEQPDVSDEQPDISEEQSDVSDEQPDMSEKQSDVSDEQPDMSEEQSEITPDDSENNDKSREIDKCDVDMSSELEELVTLCHNNQKDAAKRRYRQLALKFHPDKLGNKCLKEFQNFNDIYQNKCE